MSNLRERMKQMTAAIETAAVEQEHQSGSDGTYWKLGTDDSGNGSAIIRFLPQKDLESLPYAKVFSHWFEDAVSGKTYNEVSSSTWNDADPVGEFNSWCWKQGEEDAARSRSRKTNYYANIYVIKDPANPQNEGKVFVYRFGKKIFDKIQTQLFPEYEDDVAVNVFDMFEGRNFRIRTSKVAGYANYDKSEFEQSITPVADDDTIDTIYAQCHDLNAMFLDKSKDKSYEQKLKIMDGVLGTDRLYAQWKQAKGLDAPVAKSVAPSAQTPDEDDDVAFDTPPAPKKKPTSPAPASSAEIDDDVADILAKMGIN